MHVRAMHNVYMDSGWFKERKRELKITDTALGEALGVERSVANRVVNGAVAFNARRAAQVAQLFGVSRDEILFRAGISEQPPTEPDGRPYGQAFGQGKATPKSNQLPSTVDDDDVWVASVDLAYGMGGSFLDVDAEVERVKLSRTWLRNFTDAPPEKLGIAQGIGDSMEPLLHDRDLVVFDRSARLNDHVSDKTWVFALGQVGMIKRLRPLPDGTIKIMSANRSYPDEIAAVGELHIIGRVVASVRRH